MIFVLGIEIVRVIVFVSGFAIFFASATTLLLVLSSNVDLIPFDINYLNSINNECVTNV